MSEANKNDTRYIVSIGRFRSEQAAVARRKAALDSGLTCEIIDVKESEDIDIYTALLLIGEQMKATGDAISAMNETIACLRDATISMLDAKRDKAETKPESAVSTSDLALASLIRKRRKERGYTQDELADIVGCSNQSISRYERFGIVGNAPVLDKIMKVLRISQKEVDELCSG